MNRHVFTQEREATIQYSDVFGQTDVKSGGTIVIPSPDDIDAALTAQVGNTGHFSDGEYALSNGGALFGGYAGVLLDDLRHEQHTKAHKVLETLGIADPRDLSPEEWESALRQTHPDNKPLLRSLATSLVSIINAAVRTAAHHNNGHNGADFYVATTQEDVELYAQANMLSALDARGRIDSLYRIPNGVYWPRWEQFRSAKVSDVRRDPRHLVPVTHDARWPIPPLPEGVRLTYVDKFANTRLETNDIVREREILAAERRVDLLTKSGQLLVPNIAVVSGLSEIPPSEFGIYINPAERDTQSGPGYLELVRQVDDCNGNAEPRSYHVLSEQLGRLMGRSVQLPDWASTILQIVPSR